MVTGRQENGAISNAKCVLFIKTQEIFKIQAASNSVGLTKHINISHLFKASFERAPQIIGIQSHHILLSIILFLEERIIDKLNKLILSTLS